MSIPPDADNAAESTPPPSGSQLSGAIDRFKSSWNDSSRRPMLIFGFGAVSLAVIVLLIALFQVVAPTTPPTPTPTPDTGCTINCGAPAQVGAVVPTKLHVRDRTIDITPVAVTKGSWNATATGGQAEWVYGTLVNYLVGLPDTSENKDMLGALKEGDSITVELSNGQTLEFKFGDRQVVSSQSTDLFSQQHPGLTLVQLGDNGTERTVVRANYVVESEGSKTVPSNVVAINTPVDIDVTRVTALNGRLVENAPGIPVGSAFYLVDFTVQNLGSDPLDAGNFQIELFDYTRQKYKLSETASKLGPNPPPTGQLLPGLSATFTSGFEVPSNITGPVLVWSFRPTTTLSLAANVAVPLVGPTPTPDPRSQAIVQITQAYFTPDQSELVIVGGISNPTTALIPVGTSDISLSTPEGILATLNSTDPALPWRIAPNSTVNFTLYFSHLPSSSAILKILQNSFELIFQ